MKLNPELMFTVGSIYNFLCFIVPGMELSSFVRLFGRRTNGGRTEDDDGDGQSNASVKVYTHRMRREGGRFWFSIHNNRWWDVVGGEQRRYYAPLQLFCSKVINAFPMLIILCLNLQD